MHMSSDQDRRRLAFTRREDQLRRECERAAVEYQQALTDPANPARPGALDYRTLCDTADRFRLALGFIGAAALRQKLALAQYAVALTRRDLHAAKRRFREARARMWAASEKLDRSRIAHADACELSEVALEREYTEWSSKSECPADGYEQKNDDRDQVLTEVVEDQLEHGAAETAYRLASTDLQARSSRLAEALQALEVQRAAATPTWVRSS